jgi:hypothetical protein
MTCQETPNLSLSQPHGPGARDLERDGLGEVVLGAAVEGHERLPVQLELGRDDHAGRPGAALAVTADVAELGVFEDARVVGGGLFGLGVEPQAGGQRRTGHGSSWSFRCHQL